MRRTLYIAGACLVLLLGISATALYWLLYTEAGLHWALAQTSRLKSMELRVEGLHGRLTGPLTAERIELVHERIELTATDVRADVKLRGLLLLSLRLESLSAASLQARLKPVESRPSTRGPRFLPLAWLTVRVDHLAVGDTRLILHNGGELSATDIGAGARLTAHRLRLADIRVNDFSYAGSDAGAGNESPPPRISATGAAELRAELPTALSGNLQWTAQLQGQPAYAGVMHFDGDLAALNLDGELRQPLQAAITASLSDLASDLQWQARVDAAGFNLRPWSPESGLGDFAVAVEGSGNRQRLRLSGLLEPRSLPTGPVQIAVEGAYADRELQAERLHLRLTTNGAQLDAAGTIRFAGGPPELVLRGEWRGLGWPLQDATVRSRQGRFTFTGAMPYVYTATGDLRSEGLPAITFDGGGSVDRDRLVVSAMEVRGTGQAGVLNASGRLGWGERKSWRLTLDARDLDPSLAHEDYPGKVSFRLEASGGSPALKGPWTAELIGLRGELRSQPVSGQLQVSRTATAWDIGAAQLQFGDASLQASGRFDEGSDGETDINWRFTAPDLSPLLPKAHGNLQFSGRLSGTHDAPRLAATLEASGFQYGSYRADELHAQADLDLQEALSAALAPEDAGRLQLQIEARDAALAGTGFEFAQVALSGNTGAHVLKAEARAAGRSVELALQGAYTPKQWQGRLETLNLVAPESRLALDEPAGLFVGETRVALEPFCLTHGKQKICGRMSAEGPPGTPWPELPLTGQLEAQTRQLGFIPLLVPEIDRAAGELEARLTFSGTLGAPRMEGTLALKDGELDLYAVNLLLREVGVRLEMRGKTLSLNGSARAGEGNLAVDGKLAWESGAPSGNLDIKGENLLVANVPEARIHASPNISVGIDGRDIQVDGAVRVPYARLVPANLSGAMLPSEDEVIVGTPPADPEKSFRITTGIHLILGKDVHIESYGLSGRLTGGIAAYTAPDEVSTATGELKIEEGEYSAYGRELTIERGRLIFSGGLMSNPGVDIRASRQFPEVLAGINVRGTLRDPRLSFFSEPPLPQTQIASLLVAGRTFDSLQAGGGPGLGREQLLAQGGALLARQLGDQIGIDDVSVESGGANQETSLVLGKYLSPRLYVGYGIGLVESINTLKLRYTLGDRWTIKLEAGEARSADVVYAIEK